MVLHKNDTHILKAFHILKIKISTKTALILNIKQKNSADNNRIKDTKVQYRAIKII